jgi:hypothetical protein
MKGPAFNRGERERLVSGPRQQECHDPAQSRIAGVRPDDPAGVQSHYWLEQACKDPTRHLVLWPGAASAAGRRSSTGTADALSGTEITLGNEASTNPHVKSGAQKGQTGYGLLEWPALRRRLDRLDASYAD